jgi:hypothetical protein
MRACSFRSAIRGGAGRRVTAAHAPGGGSAHCCRSHHTDVFQCTGSGVFDGMPCVRGKTYNGWRCKFPSRLTLHKLRAFPAQVRQRFLMPARRVPADRFAWPQTHETAPPPGRLRRACEEVRAPALSSQGNRQRLRAWPRGRAGCCCPTSAACHPRQRFFQHHACASCPWRSCRHQSPELTRIASPGRKDFPESRFRNTLVIRLCLKR